MDTRNDILKWHRAVEKMNEQKVKSPSEKLEKDIKKVDGKIIGEKLKKLNMLVKKKYYEKDEEIPDEKMFQFRFEDRGNYYEFSMPLNILFGPSTRDFCSKYWDEFFEGADIKTTFKDNIAVALKQAGNISLTMKLNKDLTQEVEPPKSEGGEE